MIIVLLEFHYIFIDDIKNYYYVYIFQVFRKLAIYKFYKHILLTKI